MAIGRKYYLDIIPLWENVVSSSIEMRELGSIQVSSSGIFPSSTFKILVYENLTFSLLSACCNFEEWKTRRPASSSTFFTRSQGFIINFCTFFKKRGECFENSFRRFLTNIVSTIAFGIFRQNQYTRDGKQSTKTKISFESLSEKKMRLYSETLIQKMQSVVLETIEFE